MIIRRRTFLQFITESYSKGSRSTDLIYAHHIKKPHIVLCVYVTDTHYLNVGSETGAEKHCTIRQMLVSGKSNGSHKEKRTG